MKHRQNIFTLDALKTVSDMKSIDDFIDKWNISPSKSSLADIFNSQYEMLANRKYSRYYAASQLFNYLLDTVDVSNTNIDRLWYVKQSVIDLIVINDDVQAYTINITNNSINDLADRIKNFESVFSKINILTKVEYLPKVKQLNNYKYLGVYLIDDGKISKVKDPVKHIFKQQKDNMIVFLKQNELTNILLKYKHQLIYHDVDYGFIKSLSQTKVEQEFALQLYARKRPERDLVVKMPYSMRYLLYFTKLGKRRFMTVKQKVSDYH